MDKHENTSTWYLWCTRKATNLSFFYGSDRPLVGLPHHNNPAGAIVSMYSFPVPVQVCEWSGESRLPSAQRHIVPMITAHLHTVHEAELELTRQRGPVLTVRDALHQCSPSVNNTTAFQSSFRFGDQVYQTGKNGHVVHWQYSSG